MTINNEISAIETVLAAQAAAWSRGDLDGYLEYFWRDPRLYYGSVNTVVRGWDALRASYASRYGEGAQLGQLKFSDINIEILSEDAAMVTGRFHVTEAKLPASGSWLIVLRKFPGFGWRVVADQLAPNQEASA